MTAAVAIPVEDDTDVDLGVHVWVGRTIGRAAVYFKGEISRQEAVDDAWRDAEESGLVDEYGADEVQAAMALAFGSEP